MDTEKAKDGTRSKRPFFARRKFLIEPRVQLPLIGYLITIVLIGWVWGYIEVRTGLDGTFEDADRLGASCATLLVDLRANTLRIFLFALFANLMTVVFAVIGGILVTHRVVGPIYRLRKILAALREGEVPESMRVRQHDYFQDIFPLLDELVELRRQKGKSSQDT